MKWAAWVVVMTHKRKKRQYKHSETIMQFKLASYGYAFKLINLQELVQFYAVVLRDLVMGSTNGAIYHQWKNCCGHDDMIDTATRPTRWLQIKRVMKIFNNKDYPKKLNLVVNQNTNLTWYGTHWCTISMKYRRRQRMTCAVIRPCGDMVVWENNQVVSWI